MSERKGPGPIKAGTANGMKFAKFISTQSWEVAEAMVCFMSGPPATERDRRIGDAVGGPDIFGVQDGTPLAPAPEDPDSNRDSLEITRQADAMPSRRIVATTG